MNKPAIVPNPGSVVARSFGCRCPSLDNAWGDGAYIADDGLPRFWVTQGCPLHGIARTQPDKPIGDQTPAEDQTP